MIQAIVNEEKRGVVKELVNLMDEHPIIGVVDVESLPARNLAAMRKALRDKVVILMTKKRLMRLAFKQSKKADIGKVDEYLSGMPALLFTKENPFSLFKTLKKNQSPAAIKAGQIAPEDLVIPAGPTSFPPGPIIGELGQLGIKGGVEDGKVVIKEDAVVAKEGEEVNDKVASFLMRMGVEPMRVGLKLVAVYENGDILPGKVLDIDEDKFLADLAVAHTVAINLSFTTAYPTKDTIELLIKTAHNDASTLALETNVITSDTLPQLLAKASAQATGLQQLVPAEPAKEKPADKPEEKKDDKPEEKKEEPAEEKPEENKPPVEEKPAKAEPAEKPQEKPQEKQEETPTKPADTAKQEKPEPKQEPPAEPKTESSAEPEAKQETDQTTEE